MAKMLHIMLVIVLIILFWPAEGYSYIDPGAGSNYLQKCLGGLFSFIVMLRGLFRSLFKKRSSTSFSKKSKKMDV